MLLEELKMSKLKKRINKIDFLKWYFIWKILENLLIWKYLCYI